MKKLCVLTYTVSLYWRDYYLSENFSVYIYAPCILLYRIVIFTYDFYIELLYLAYVRFLIKSVK
jgi:hypothetical protein